MPLILIILLLFLLFGAAPVWPYSRAWSYYLSGGLGFVPVIVVLVLLTRRSRL